jgi:hypothetical protein
LASAKEIPPGGEGKIEATLRTGARGGKTAKTITVTTNDPDQHTIQLKLAAEVQVALALEPYLINFGRFKKGETPVRYVSVIGDDKDSTKIISAEAKNKSLKVEINQKGFENNKDNRIKISVLPDMKVGQFRDVIAVITDHKANKNMNISVFGEVVGDIVVTPRSFSFGFFERGKAPEKIVTLKATTPATFKVLKVESTSPDVIVEKVVVTEGREYQIKARVKDNFDKDYLRGNIIITTDNKEQPTIEVMYFGRVQKAAGTMPGQRGSATPPMTLVPPAH